MLRLLRQCHMSSTFYIMRIFVLCLVGVVLFSDAFAATDDVDDFLEIDADALSTFLEELNPFSGGLLKFLTGTGAIDCPLVTTITGLIVSCMRDTVREAIDAFGNVFYDVWEPVIAPMMMLSVLFFGIEVMSGEPEVKKKFFALAFRLGAVSMFAEDLNGNADNIFATMEALQELVTDSLVTTTVGAVSGLFSCPVGTVVNLANESLGGDPSNILWVRLDCILMQLFGIGVSVDLPIVGEVAVGNPNGLAGSVLGILFGLLATGSFGMICFGFGISLLMSVTFFGMRVVYTFIVAYVMVGFLIVIAPMMVPFLLFPRYLGPMFDKWLMNLIGTMAMPAMLFACLTVSLTMMDVAIFNPLNPFSMNNVFNSDEMSEAFISDTPLCEMNFIKNLPFYNNIQMTDADGNRTAADMGGEVNQFVFGTSRNFLTPTMNGASDICDILHVPTLDIPKAFDGDTNESSFLIRFAISLFSAVVIAQLALKLYDQFASVSIGIFGGGGNPLLKSMSNAPLQAEITKAVNVTTKGVATALTKGKVNLGGNIEKVIGGKASLSALSQGNMNKVNQQFASLIGLR